MVSPFVWRIYSYLRIFWLPFEFLFFEFFPWDKRDLLLIAKMYSATVTVLLLVCASGIMVSLWKVQADSREDDLQNRQIQELKEGAHETEKVVDDVRLELRDLTASVRVLISLAHGLGWLLGFVGFASVIRIANNVFGMKWRLQQKANNQAG